MHPTLQYFHVFFPEAVEEPANILRSPLKNRGPHYLADRPEFFDCGGGEVSTRGSSRDEQTYVGIEAQLIDEEPIFDPALLINHHAFPFDGSKQLSVVQGNVKGREQHRIATSRCESLPQIEARILGAIVKQTPDGRSRVFENAHPARKSRPWRDNQKGAPHVLVTEVRDEGDDLQSFAQASIVCDTSFA